MEGEVPKTKQMKAKKDTADSDTRQPGMKRVHFVCTDWAGQLGRNGWPLPPTGQPPRIGIENKSTRPSIL